MNLGNVLTTGGVTLITIAVIVWLFWRIAFMFLCNSLAAHKGYSGYWLTGFIFGFIGLLYIGFLPTLEREDNNCVEEYDDVQLSKSKRYIDQQQYLSQHSNNRADKHEAKQR